MVAESGLMQDGPREEGAREEVAPEGAHTNVALVDLPLPDFGLHGRVALVTGASSGLGQHFAQLLAKAGATVVVAARRCWIRPRLTLMRCCRPI